MYIIVYNGLKDRTIIRIYLYLPMLEVGQINGYGWYIVAIQQLYKCNFYTLETIKKFYEEEDRKIDVHNSRVKRIIKFIDNLLK